MPTPTAPLNSRSKVLDAATQAIRSKGYIATSVDDICTAAKAQGNAAIAAQCVDRH